MRLNHRPSSILNLQVVRQRLSYSGHTNSHYGPLSRLRPSLPALRHTLQHYPFPTTLSDDTSATGQTHPTTLLYPKSDRKQNFNMTTMATQDSPNHVLHSPPSPSAKRPKGDYIPLAICTSPRSRDTSRHSQELFPSLPSKSTTDHHRRASSTCTCADAPSACERKHWIIGERNHTREHSSECWPPAIFFSSKTFSTSEQQYPFHPRGREHTALEMGRSKPVSDGAGEERDNEDRRAEDAVCQALRAFGR